MPDHSFVIVAVVAFLAPVLREMIPGVFVPAIVFELVGGMILGPHVLGIADTTQSVELFARRSGRGGSPTRRPASTQPGLPSLRAETSRL